MIVGLDFETHLMEEGCTIPRPICISVSYRDADGDLINYVSKDCKTVFTKFFNLAKTGKAVLVMHNASFDLSVAIKWLGIAKDDVISLVFQKRLHCTKIREDLYEISTKGFTISGNGLALLVDRYMQIDIKETKNDGWRLKYSKLEKLMLDMWPKEAVEYAKKDALYCMEIYKFQEELRQPEGVGSMNTEDIHLAAAIALAFMTNSGMFVDVPYLEELKETFEQKVKDSITVLMDLGLMATEKGKYKKETKKFHEYLKGKYPNKLKYGKIHKITGKKSIKADSETLQIIQESLKTPDGVIAAWQDYMASEKMLSTYINPMLKTKTGKIHSGYTPVVNSGRTSSTKFSDIGSIQTQNLPRGNGIRDAFIPENDDEVLGAIDFGGIELCSFANTLYQIYGQSQMLDFINSGDIPKDIHSVVGAFIYEMKTREPQDYESFQKLKKDDPDIFKLMRTVAKVVGLGYPGLLGEFTMLKQLKTYGIDIHKNEMSRAIKGYEILFPENYAYKTNWINKQQILKDSGRKFKRSANDQEERAGNYSYSVGKFFRNQCSATACSNGRALQTPTALGAKLALVRCFLDLPERIVPRAFIHDEILFTFKRDSYKEDSELAARIMLKGMQDIFKYVRLNVEIQIMEYEWKKGGPFLWEKVLWVDPIS